MRSPAHADVIPAGKRIVALNFGRNALTAFNADKSDKMEDIVIVTNVRIRATAQGYRPGAE
jgi:hypothetical protein